ncbi:MAG: AMP-binding protein [Alphaproteobacteria bacterium]|jgi:propionyl-CoA synthetase|nr:AMP-binding protein [Alphaproteobacteria bacterium]
MGRYAEVHSQSINDPEGFWGKAAEEIDWYKKWDKVLDGSNAPFYRWFVGGELNTCYNAVDRHVERGRADQPAIIYDSPVTNTVRKITYGEFQDLTAKFGGALRSLGVEKGDRVIIYMPMVPEALVAMLGCARIGAIHSVVFGGFAPNELATRINDAKPKVIVSASCGIEGAKVIPYKPMLDGAIDQAEHKVDGTIVMQRPQAEAPLKPGFDHDWTEITGKAEPADCVPVAATDPLYILYTSGTTGNPKGIVRDNGGHAVAMKYTMKNFYNCDPGEVFWAASDVGWVVGHSYIVYAPLLHGATTVVFEGKPVGTPDAGTFWRVISQHKIPTMFTAPTAFRAIKREDPNAELMKSYDLSHFRALFLAGERSDPDTIKWAENNLKVPVIDHWWQTETAWVIAGNPLGTELFPVKYGSACKPGFGWDIHAVGPDGHDVPAGDVGSLVAKLPMPPGTLMTLWQADDRCRKAYFDEFPGFYMTGDAGFVDEDGYVHVMTRVDDVINVAGHRLSTGGMEEILSAHPDVAEAAVIGAADELKGQMPVGFIVLKSGVSKSHSDVCAECVKMVREQIGAVAAFKTCTVVDRLPKTRSGKVLRGTMKKIADSEEFKMPATIDDPVILDEIREALQKVGYAGVKAA